MKTSDSIAKLAPALLKAQREVKAAVKTGTNPHFKNRYAPLEEVISACKDSLNANGLAFVQGAEPTNGDTLDLTTRLLHESGEWIESTLTMRPVKVDPQGIGSCITYARRYALAAICGMASEEDDDGNAASQPEAVKTKAAPKAATNGDWSCPAHNKTLYDTVFLPLMKEAGGDMSHKRMLVSKAFGAAGVMDACEQPADKFAQGCDRLQALIEESK